MDADKQYNIEDEQAYQKALATLNRGAQAPAVLRLLMRAFEAYRAARKMGWSRPWNKYELINFQSFRLRPGEDGDLIELGRQLLDEAFPERPAQARAFIDTLLRDDDLMGFIFCHEYRHQGRNWEGATLSLGRKAQKRYRDRLDIILESELLEGESRGLSRVRVYVDPYTGKSGGPLWQAVLEPADKPTAERLFARLSEISWTWFADTERRWDHWTSRYIDYFGERRQDLQCSYFHLPGRGEGRLLPTESRSEPR